MIVIASVYIDFMMADVQSTIFACIRKNVHLYGCHFFAMLTKVMQIPTMGSVLSSGHAVRRCPFPNRFREVFNSSLVQAKVYNQKVPIETAATLKQDIFPFKFWQDDEGNFKMPFTPFKHHLGKYTIFLF